MILEIRLGVLTPFGKYNPDRVVVAVLYLPVDVLIVDSAVHPVHAASHSEDTLEGLIHCQPSLLHTPFSSFITTLSQSAFKKQVT